MKKRRTRPCSFGNGIADVYEPSSATNDYAARTNPRLSDMKPIGRLWYREHSIREQDMETMSQRGYDLALKISTHRVDWVTHECVIVTRGLAYGVAHIDKTDPYAMYLYLEGGYEIDG